MGMTASGSIVHRVTRKMALSSWTSLVEPVFSAFIASLLRRSCAVRLTIATTAALAQPLIRAHLLRAHLHSPPTSGGALRPPAQLARPHLPGPCARLCSPPAFDDPSVTHCTPAGG